MGSKGHRLLACGVAAALAFAAPPAGSQGTSTLTRGAELRALAQELRQRDQADKARVAEFARQTGLPTRMKLPGGRGLALQRFSPAGRPVFYLTYNLDAADTVSTDEVWPGGSSGLGLDGSGMLVGLWDYGAVDPTHVDFTGRLVQVDAPVPAGVSGHSTHVAGTLVGTGEGYPIIIDGNYLAQGMAFGAQLDAYDWESDTAEMATAAAAGLGISNHSYGIAAGWLNTQGSDAGVVLDGNPDVSVYNWWWLGGPDDTDLEDPYFGYYDAEAALWDQIALDAPYFLIVKAAGNDRTDIGPSPGETYLVIDELVVDPVTMQEYYTWFESTLPRPFDCAPAGYDCVPTFSGAKNILTVGAVDDLPGGYAPLAGPNQVSMSPFSGWGPTDDGRIKPDLVGNGVFLLSAYPPNTYAAAAGTSMAAPNVTGSLLLVQQHYENLNGGAPMLATTLKALAIHTADEAGDADGPDYQHGWGLLNTRSATELLSDLAGPDPDHHVIEATLADGATNSHPISITVTDARVTATLVWADPPGTPVTPLALDAPDPMLVNDLDLRVTDASGTHLPWVLDPANPADPATQGDNTRDNVEQVVITGGAPGTYTVEVSHKGTLQNAPQAYSLIVSQVSEPPVSSELLIDEDFSGGMPSGWSADGTGAQWEIRDPNATEDPFENNTLGSGRFAMVHPNYSVFTNSWLRLPELDFSASPSVVVRFQSQYNYDLWETLFLEVSTNGGASFNPVWQFQGFNPFPTPYVLDVSGAAGGQASAIFRFRFDSGIDPVGDYWQLDDIQVEAIGGAPAANPPGPATNPVPADGAPGVALDTDLGWSAGADTDTHEVYFSTTTPLDGGAFQGSQTADGFDPGMLATGTTYYWRVDEVNAEGTTAGPTWSFTTLGSLPPQAMNDNAVVDEDDSTDIAVLANDSDPDGDPLSVTAVTNPPNGTATVNPDDTVAYTPDANFHGADSFSYTVADGNGGSDTATVSVTVNPVNDLPVALDDSASTTENDAVVIAVLDNDSDVDGEALGVVSVTDGAFGTVTHDGTQVTYQPNPGASGQDSFTYVAGDGHPGSTDTATVTVDVAPNLAPTAAFTAGTSDLTANFTDTSTDGDGTVVSWSWEFGDGNVSDIQNPSHEYATGGTYTVTLTVTDDDGASDATSQDVTVTAPNVPPTASFTSSTTDLAAVFTDTSTDDDGSIASWSWDFGDGNGSASQNPSHEYASGGTYAVTLTVIDDDGASDSDTQNVTVTEPPNQAPTASFTAGTSDLTATFTDTSTDGDGSIASWSWDFGDGNGSTSQNASHEYAAGGTYTVTLTVTDDDGASDIDTQDVTVTEPPNQAPAASFTAGTSDLTANFTDTSTDGDGTVVSWSWVFGDGNGSSSQNPSHAYAAAGTYTVTLTVTDDDGASGSDSQDVTVTEPPAVLSVGSISPNQSGYPNTLPVTVSGTGFVAGASLAFINGSGQAPTVTNVTVVDAGTLTATVDIPNGGPKRERVWDVTVTNPGGASDTLAGAFTVTVGGVTNSPPTASFTAGTSDLTASFTDTSTDGDGSVVSWSWDFGDGNGSTSQNPSHTYAAAGAYSVTLTVTDDDGASDSDTQSVTVTDPSSNSPPTASFTAGTSDLTASFTDTSTDGDGSIVSWSWNFGDGNGSASQNPSHTYAAAGTYAVTLTVTDDDGATDSDTQSVTVTEASAGLTVASITPDQAGAPSTLTVTVSGAGFAPGAALALSGGSGPAPSVSNVVVLDGGTLTATIDVPAGGPKRTRTWDVTVSNPGGASDTLAGAFTVIP